MLFKPFQLFGSLDIPLDEQVVKGMMEVSGWVLASNPKGITIEFFIDDHLSPERVMSIDRSDVLKIYPTYAHTNPTPGFATRINTRAFENGTHELKCVAKQGRKTKVLGKRTIHFQNRVKLNRSKDAKPINLSSDPVLYIHIPKTAGTSLNKYLEAQFSPDETFFHLENFVFKTAPDEASGLENKRLLTAHLKLDTIKKYVDVQKYFTMTMLRDPIRQTISHLAWIKRLGDPDHEGELNNHPEYIKRIVEHLYHDDVVRFLFTLTEVEKNFFDNCQTRYFLPFHGEVELTDQHFHDALYQMAQFDLVGITEKYEATLILLSFLMAWKPPASPERLNPSNKAHLLDFDVADEEVKKALNHVTRYDTQLYRYAVAMFERHFRQMLHLMAVEFPDLKDYLSKLSKPIALDHLAEWVELHGDKARGSIIL